MTSAETWVLDRDIATYFEVETALVRKLLPPKCQPQEVRPGISLLCFSVHHFVAGNLGGRMPAFGEATCSVVIQPFHTAGSKAPPQVAVAVVYVASACREFVDYAREYDKMPGHYDPELRVEIVESASHGSRVEVTGAHGPVVTLENQVEPLFLPATVSLQVVTWLDNTLHHTDVTWRGELFEHQKLLSGGDFFSHPWLPGVEVPTGPKRAYHQQLHRSGALGRVTFERRPPIWRMPGAT